MENLTLFYDFVFLGIIINFVLYVFYRLIYLLNSIFFIDTYFLFKKKTISWTLTTIIQNFVVHFLWKKNYDVYTAITQQHKYIKKNEKPTIEIWIKRWASLFRGNSKNKSSKLWFSIERFVHKRLLIVWRLTLINGWALEINVRNDHRLRVTTFMDGGWQRSS